MLAKLLNKKLLNKLILLSLSFLQVSRAYNLLQLPIEERGDYCGVFFDIDSHYYDGLSELEIKLINCKTNHSINNAIDAWNQQVSIPKLYLLGIHYHPNLKFNYDNPQRDILKEYSQYLGQYSDNQSRLDSDKITSDPVRGMDKPRATESCINFLISRDPIDTSSYGYAYISRYPISSQYAGVCNTRIEKKERRISNLAMGSIGKITNINAFTNLESLILHEIGHSVGSEHDCCQDDRCHLCPPDDKTPNQCLELKNPFIMNPVIATGKNRFTFSRCSLNYFDKIMNMEGRQNCLRNITLKK